MNLLTLVVVVTLSAGGGKSAPKSVEPPAPPAWLGDQMPLPLAVKTPEDLAFKSAAEKQYLVFNLLGGGKLAWDRGDWAMAADKWESLLRLDGLTPELVDLVKPWAAAARERAGGAAANVVMPVPSSATPTSVASAKDETATPAPPPVVTVNGSVSGGGSAGPGGAVVMLKRADGSTPKPRAVRKTVAQKQKRFLPGVLAIPVGSTIQFSNDDDIFHSVFSLSKPNEFDLGLYKAGETRDQVFNDAGPVQLLCNIHSSMSAWIYVVDTPWFAQADSAGRFSIKGVPPGSYRLQVWHPRAAKTTERPLRVGGGMEQVVVAVDGDKPQPAFVPDKYGKPRQPQLGY